MVGDGVPYSRVFTEAECRRAIVFSFLLVISLAAPYGFVTVGAADGQPDLEVIDVWTEPTDPKAGENVEFCMEVENTGTSTADDIEVRAYVDGELAAVPPTKTLGPGERSTTVCTGNNEFEGGTYSVRAAIDPDNHIPESDETNNEIERSFTVETSYGSIRGRVTDTDGNPISGAKVYLDATDDTRTDSDGYFSYAQVPAGDHEVDVAMSGYEVDGPKYVTVSEDETSQVDFVLEPETHTVRLGSSPVSVSTSGEGTYDYGEDVSIDAPTNAGDYEFQAWTTDDGTVVSEESSFTISYINRDYDITAQYTRPGKPDLTITDISPEPSSPDAGDSVTFDVDVANRGEARASNFNLELVAGSDIYRAEEMDLPAGDSGTVVIGDWTAEGDVDEIRAEIDYDDSIDEEDETNNEHREPLDVTEQQPNLRIVDIDPSPRSPEDGESVSFDVTVENTGPVATDDFGVLVSVDGQQYSETRVDLRAGGRQTVTVGPWDADSSVDGGEAIVDFRDAVDENDESDNTERFSLSVERRESDLKIEEIEWRPADPTTDERVEFRLRLANDGDRAAQDVESVVRVDGDVVARPAPIDVRANDNAWTAWSGDFRGDSGQYDVGATVDPGDQVKEGDETNNDAHQTLTIGSEVGAVDGYVRDQETGDPIVDATVRVNGETQRTDSDGAYRFTELPAGLHRVTAESPTHGEQVTTVSVAAGETTSHTFRLTKQAPNLQVKSVDWTPTEAQVGESVAVSVTVANTGTESATGFDLTVQASNEQLTRSDLDITAQATREFDIGQVPITEDTEAIVGVVDPDDIVEESNEGDNRQSESLRVQSRTDLRMGTIRTDPSTPVPDGNVEPFARVVNDGDRTIRDIPVTLTIDGRRHDTKAVTLEPKSARLVRFGSWEPTSGNHDVAVEIDPTDQVSEHNESNNRNETRIEVTRGVGAATLVVEDSDGNPIEDATVELSDERVMTTDNTGRVRFDEVPARTYEVSIDAREFEQQTTTIQIEADSTRRETVALSTSSSGEIDAVRGLPEEFEPGTNREVEVTVANPGPVEQRYTLDLLASSAIDADRDQRSVVVPEGETETVTIDLSFGATETEQSLALELRADDGTRLDRFQRYTDPVPSETPLEVTVTDQDQNAVSDATVEVVGPVRESARTDADGRAVFTDPEPGDYLIQVSADEIQGGSETIEATVTGDESDAVSITVETTTDEATLDGTVTWDDGSTVKDATAVLKVDDGDGARTTTITDGSFTFPASVQPNKYRLVVRQDDEVVSEESVWLEEGSNSVSLTAETADQNMGRVKSSITGVVMGDWCWRDEGSPPAYCGDEVSTYPIAFFAGWLASGFAVVGDIRDLPSTALKGKPVDFGLTIIGLIPLYGDATSALSKVGKFLGKFPSKTDDVVDMIITSKHFEGHRIAGLDKAYDGAGSRLVRNTDLTEDEVVRMADNGHDLRNVRKLSEMGLSAEAIRGMDRVSWADPKRTRRWLEDAEEINGGSTDELVRDIDSELVEKANTPSSSPGHLYEAKVASYSKREADVVGKTLGNGRSVKRVSKNIETPRGKTDIDVLMSDGTAVEVKRSLPMDEDLIEKFEKFEQFQRRNGYQGAERYLVVGTEKSELKKRNPELVKKLQEQGVKIVTDRDEVARSVEPEPVPVQGTSRTISTKYSSVTSG